MPKRERIGLTSLASWASVIVVLGGTILRRVLRAPTPRHDTVPNNLPSEADTTLRLKQLDILLKEMEQRFNEMRDYNNRYQQAMLLYLSALGAALGLTVSGKLNISAIAEFPDAPVVIFLFITLNLLVLFHGVTLSSWSMSYAKYNAVFLAPRIAELAEMAEGPVSFDRWGSDVKRVALRARGIGYLLWFGLVIMTCVGSLTLPRYGAYAAGGIGPRTLMIGAAVALPALLLLTLHTAFSDWFITPHYFNPEPPDVSRTVWLVTVPTWTGLVVTGFTIVFASW
jgi:hypothetical protein